MATGKYEKVTNVNGSGYVKMPDGTFIAYGLFEVIDQTTGGDYNTLELPITPIKLQAIVFSGVQADLGQEFASYKSRNGKTVTVSVLKPAGWAAFHYIAIGSWK